MCLIFGGTTEGKQVIQLMQQLNKKYHYSTKTRVEYSPDQLGVYRHGPLDVAALTAYVQKYRIDQFINAAHPFAIQLHQTVATVSQNLDIPVYRIERKQLKRQSSPLFFYVESYEEALKILHSQFEGRKLLALSGVQSIAALNCYWKQYPTMFRILNRPSSIAMAQTQKFPVSQLILAYPNKELEKEVELYKTNGIQLVLTKESGDSGQLAIKIAAVQALNIPIIIIKRPELPKSFQFIYDWQTLTNKLFQ